MKTLVLLAALLLPVFAIAGTLTIIPDSTSSMGIEKQHREAAERAAAEQAPSEGGIEARPRVKIIRQQPVYQIYQQPQKRHYDCHVYGYQNREIACD